MPKKAATFPDNIKGFGRSKSNARGVTDAYLFVDGVSLAGVRPAGAPVDVPYYSDIPVLAEADELLVAVRARQTAKHNIELLEAEVKIQSATIAHLLTIAKVDSVGVDHWKVTRAAGRTTRTLTGLALLRENVEPAKIAAAATKVDAQALLGNGVPATAIKRATVETPGEPYLVVTDAKKEKKGEK